MGVDDGGSHASDGLGQPVRLGCERGERGRPPRGDGTNERGGGRDPGGLGLPGDALPGDGFGAGRGRGSRHGGRGSPAAAPHPHDAQSFCRLAGGVHGFRRRGHGLVRGGVRGAPPSPRARVPAGRHGHRRADQDERVHRGCRGRLPGRGRVGLGDGGGRPGPGAGRHPAAGGERGRDRDGTLAGADL